MFRIDGGHSVSSSREPPRINGRLPAVNNLHKGLTAWPQSVCALHVMWMRFLGECLCVCARECMMHGLSTAIDP